MHSANNCSWNKIYKEHFVRIKTIHNYYKRNCHNLKNIEIPFSKHPSSGEIDIEGEQIEQETKYLRKIKGGKKF